MTEREVGRVDAIIVKKIQGVEAKVADIDDRLDRIELAIIAVQMEYGADKVKEILKGGKDDTKQIYDESS